MGCCESSPAAMTEQPRLYTPSPAHRHGAFGQSSNTSSSSSITAAWPGMSSSTSASSLQCQASPRRGGRQAVLRHKRHEWPKKRVQEAACYYDNNTRRLDGDWFGLPNQMNQHYHTAHCELYEASREKTCPRCLNRFATVKIANGHKTACLQEGWVRYRLVDDV